MAVAVGSSLASRSGGGNGGAVPLGVCGGIPVVSALLMSLLIPKMMGLISEPASLTNALQRLAAISKTAASADAAERDALEIYIAGRFGKTIADEKTWSNP